MKKFLAEFFQCEASIATAEHSILVAVALFSFVGCLNTLALLRYSYVERIAFAMPIPGVSVPRDEKDSGSTFDERHFRIEELAEKWAYGRETIRLLVKDEPGVLKRRGGAKQAHTTYSVPESVARRIYARLQAPASMNGVDSRSVAVQGRGKGNHRFRKKSV